MSLARQALSNLVRQFARPLDFLRELVQNAIDAGSPRVAVWVDFTPDAGATTGVLEVHVDDWGDGMDRHIIDTQLTRLFSSSKEGDLTKIGKFGIGFTSIFAVRPDAVLVRTSRNGEGWEVLFHADRTYEIHLHDDPLTGTRITLVKRMEAARVDGWVDEARSVLLRWCEHSRVPVTFSDRRRVAVAVPEASSDPFAAFADPTGAPEVEVLSCPLALDGAALQVHYEADGVEVLVGYGAEPLVGFYNSGLTLVRGQRADVLGAYLERLGHLQLKVRYDRLEHTLTRDNVLRDVHWARAMGAVLRAVDLLRAQLLDRAEAVAREGGGLDPWHRLLAVEEAARPLDMGGRRVLRDTTGALRTPDELASQEWSLGFVLLGEPGQHVAALGEAGLVALVDTPAVRLLLHALPPLRRRGARGAVKDVVATLADGAPLGTGRILPRVLRSIDDVFVLPEVLDPSTLPAREQALLRDTSAVLRMATGGRVRLLVGQVGAAEALAYAGTPGGRLVARESGEGWDLGFLLRWRTLLVNREHPVFHAWLLLVADQPDLAAYGLAQGLLHAEGAEWEPTYGRLIGAAVALED